jgi:ribonuclease D
VKLAPEYISDRRHLEAISCRVRHVPRLALDTEFVGENTFVPRLELVQIATPDVAAIIDVPAVGSLEPLTDVLKDPATEKIVHAGRQDLELLASRCGGVPVPIFDTQLAAAMVGYGTQVAYAQLVHRIIGTKLGKSHTLTNWSQRPLTAEQLTYAIDDVLFLLPIQHHLEERLKALGRLHWAQEEFARMGARLHESNADPRERYQRMRGWENLRPRAAAVFRELVAWREKEAAGRNIPRGRVLRDEVLLELARQAPTTISGLRGTRGLPTAEMDRSGGVLVGVIRDALALPEAEWPRAERPRRSESESPGQVELLQAVLKACAERSHMAPTLLATAADLQTLIETHRNRQQTSLSVDLPILSGWRRALAGDTLLDVLNGKLSVSLDPATGKLSLSPSPSADA